MGGSVPASSCTELQGYGRVTFTHGAGRAPAVPRLPEWTSSHPTGGRPPRLPRALGQPAPAEHGSGSFLGVQELPAPLAGAGCRARVCPAAADLRAGPPVGSRGHPPHVPPFSLSCRSHSSVDSPHGACGRGAGAGVSAAGPALCVGASGSVRPPVTEARRVNRFLSDTRVALQAGFGPLCTGLLLGEHSTGVLTSTSACCSSQRRAPCETGGDEQLWRWAAAGVGASSLRPVRTAVTRSECLAAWAPAHSGDSRPHPLSPADHQEHDAHVPDAGGRGPVLALPHRREAGHLGEAAAARSPLPLED